MASRIELGLNKIDCRKVSNLLKNVLKNSKGLTYRQFRSFLKRMCSSRMAAPGKLDSIAWQLFGFLDYNQNASIDKTELANQLILMSGGDKRQKIEAAFKYYDQDNSGSLC